MRFLKVLAQERFLPSLKSVLQTVTTKNDLDVNRFGLAVRRCGR